ITAYRVSEDGSVIEDVTTRKLGSNEAYVKVTRSGLCGIDKHGLKAGIALGHKGAGIVERIETSVQSVSVGDRVGFRYIHKVCGRCENCLKGTIADSKPGMDVYCTNKSEFGSHDHDLGSFSSHTVVDADALYGLPDGPDPAHAAPSMCGGATVWGGLPLYGDRATDRVGVVGIGALGHRAIQFAATMGCEVVVFSSTESKRTEAIKQSNSERKSSTLRTTSRSSKASRR
ncbi:chaperonin 10-like protein, partial [Cryomyces antarcticus]